MRIRPSQQLLRCIGISLALLTACGGATGIVSGRAFLLGQSDHGNIGVSLSGGADGKSYNTVTASDGAFRFKDVPPGLYVLTYSAALHAVETVQNVLVAPGEFHALDVTLLPASPFSPQAVSSATFVGNNSHAVVSFGSSPATLSYVLDTATGALQPVTAGTFTVHGGDEAGTSALVSANGLLQHLDLATGALTPVTPPALSFLGAHGSKGYYTVANGDLYAVSFASATGELLLASPACATGSFSGMSGIGNAEPSSYWKVITWQASGAVTECAPYTTTAYLLIPDTGTPDLKFVTNIEYSPDRTLALVREPTGRMGSTTLFTVKRVDLAARSTTTVQAEVASMTIDSKWEWVAVEHHPTEAGKRTYGAFAPLNGVVVNLATEASAFSGYSGTSPANALRFVTSSSDVVQALRYDLKTAVPLCPSSAPTYGSLSGIVACASGGASPGLILYDPQTHTARQLSTQPTTGVAINSTGLVWTESGTTTKGYHLSGTAAVTLCEGTFRLSGASSDGRSIAYTCVAPDTTIAWKSANLVTGTSFDVTGTLTVPITNTNRICNVAPAGNVLCVFTSSELPSLSCGSTYCVLVASSNGRTTVYGASSTNVTGTWSSDSTGLLGTFSGSLSAVDFYTTPPLVRSVATTPGGSIVAVGRRGANALYYSGSYGSTLLLADGTAMSVGNRPDVPRRLGTSNEYVITDSVLKLDTGIVSSLGTSISDTRYSADGSVLSFLDGMAHDLKSYTPGEGLRHLGTDCTRATSTGVGAVLYYCAGSVAKKLLLLDPETGTAATVSTSVAPSMTGVGDNVRSFIFSDPSPEGRSGTLQVLDSKTGQVTDLRARGDPLQRSDHEDARRLPGGRREGRSRALPRGARWHPHRSAGGPGGGAVGRRQQHAAVPLRRRALGPVAAELHAGGHRTEQRAGRLVVLRRRQGDDLQLLRARLADAPAERRLPAVVSLRRPHPLPLVAALYPSGRPPRCFAQRRRGAPGCRRT